jgi:long-chain acyl-CoA synthetase
MTVTESILEPLRKHQGKVISRDHDTELTGGQLLAGAQTVAGKLAECRGRMVGLLLPNCAGYPAALLGTIWAGKVAVPLNPMLKLNELEFILNDAGIETVVVAEATRALAAGLAVRALPVSDLLQRSDVRPATSKDANADELAVMLYTSGTSGKPKGVPLTHNNLLSNARSLIALARLTDRDVVVGVLPMFHAFGLTGTMLIPLLLGAEVTYLRFTPERAAATLAERKATLFVAVPGMFGLLARAKGSDEGIKNLTYAVAGGEALPTNIREAYARRAGRPLLEGYGLTETSPVVALNVPEANKPGTVGRPLPEVNVRIALDGDSPLPVGQEGEIQVQGPNVMKGYHNRPEENAGSFTPDGWFRTGDLGRLDSEGYLSISGRIKELIIRAGEKVMPGEVEEVLCQFPGVAEAAVIGEADGDRGEAVVAFLTSSGPPPSVEGLREFCRSRLAEFKIPRRFTIAKDLPRGPTGKILKRALRNWKPA